MTRLVVFATDLTALAAIGCQEAGIRWGTEKEDVLAGLPDYSIAIEQPGECRTAVLQHEGQIVARSVFRTVYTPYSDWAVFRLGVSDVMTTDGFVLPQFRGQRSMGRLKSFAAKDFSQLGYKRFLSCVKARNASSIRSQETLGAEAIFWLRRYCLFGVSLIWGRGHFALGRFGPHRRYVIDCCAPHQT